MSSGETEAAKTELANVQTAVVAAMAGEGVSACTAGALDSDTDVVVGTSDVGTYIMGGNEILVGTCAVAGDGTVTQSATGYEPPAP